MKIERDHPTRKYPYLAVWAGAPDCRCSEVEKAVNTGKYEMKEVVVVSQNPRDLGETIITPLLGGKIGHVTKKENEYMPLLPGSTVFLTQE